MDFNKAVEMALRTWYPENHPLHNNPHHPLGKLLGEWGELLDDYMKSLYKPGYEFKPGDELGDIWYYVRILAHQHNYQPEIYDHWQITSNDIDYLIGVAMYRLSAYFCFEYTNDDITIEGALDVSYIVLNKICNCYNLTLDDLTRSNWEKLKPGSERGEQWRKARVETSYAPEGK